jgi:DNA-binding NarL/FixJ family response regulator
MKQIKVVVVDDSPFSVELISNILKDKGFQVAGSAQCLKEAVDAVSKLKPDLVTMDIAMPGADGIECTEAIRRVDPNIRVIIISSMMDDEIVRRAKKAGVSGYVQKPVDAEELALQIGRIMADESLYIELERLYYDAFKESTNITINKLFHETPVFREEQNVNNEKISRGFSVVMGIIGRYGGRMLLDMSDETARNLAACFNREQNSNNEATVNVLVELSNIIAGNACSMLNHMNSLFGFRVAPPTAVYGESVKISKAELSTVSSVIGKTSFGDIYLNIGFSRSENHE